MASIINGKTARQAKWILPGILLLAAGLRLWGVSFGLPYLYHPDEPRYVTVAGQLFRSGTVDPNEILSISINSFVYTLNALAYALYFLVGKAFGALQTAEEIPAFTWLAMGTGRATMPVTFLMGRLLTVYFSTAAVALLYAAVRKLTRSPAGGLLAAFLLAVSPITVLNSKFIAPDGFLVFFICLGLWASVRIWQDGDTRGYLVAGLAIGLAASTKANGALIVIPVVVAHFWRRGRAGILDYRLLLAAAASVVALVATTPFLLVDPAKVYADWRFEADHYATGHIGMEGDTLRYYLSALWRAEGPAGVLALVALFWGVVRRSRPVLFLAIFPVLYFLFISSFPVRNARTALPLLPFLFALAAFLLVTLSARIRQTEPEGRRRLLLSALALVVAATVALPCWRTLQNNRRLAMVDSRETARVWIDTHLGGDPAGTKIALESYAPFVDPTRFGVTGVFQMTDHPADWYVANGFDYLVVSQGMFGRFFRAPERYPDEVARYEALFNRFRHVKTFTDGGYEVRIYQVTE